MSQSAALVGGLYCQQNSYAKTLNTIVVSVNKAKNGTEIEFNDTVLFPEGGGQPSDTGTVALNDTVLKISSVRREGLKALHTVDTSGGPLVVGSEVKLQVDWDRRWDHMQQHTGQHLLSALLDKRDCPTLGWALGSSVCYVELPRPLTDTEISEVSAEIDEIILENRPIQLVDSTGAKTHKVPDDYDIANGVIRVISIEGIDSNTCCGTHLSSTGHIQAIALLHQEKVRGKNSRLYFLAGKRVQDAAVDGTRLKKDLCAQLSCVDADISAKVNQLNQRLKQQQTRTKTASARLAKFTALSLKAKPGVYYEPDFDMDFIKLVEKELKGEPGSFAIFCGSRDSAGSIILWGPKCDALASATMTVLPETKGGGKSRWQGRLPTISAGDVNRLCAALDSVLLNDDQGKLNDG